MLMQYAAANGTTAGLRQTLARAIAASSHTAMPSCCFLLVFLPSSATPAACSMAQGSRTGALRNSTESTASLKALLQLLRQANSETSRRLTSTSSSSTSPFGVLCFNCRSGGERFPQLRQLVDAMLLLVDDLAACMMLAAVLPRCPTMVLMYSSLFMLTLCVGKWHEAKAQASRLVRREVQVCLALLQRALSTVVRSKYEYH